MSSRDDLLLDIEAFLKRWGMDPAHFGIDSVGDHKLVARLRDGKDVRLGTADRIKAFMRTYSGNGKKRPASSSVAA